MTPERVHPVDVGEDDPLRLAEAARIAFPDGSMTASGLRRERDRGHLAVERIAGKDYTTLRDIREMRKRCRVTGKVPASGFNRQGEIETVASSSKPSGSSEMDPSNAALASARARIKALSMTPSPTTSPASAKSHGSATATRLRS
jgi:hypothetical protein